MLLMFHLQRRKLDAVYYYMRSLMASNPFLSAKDSLITLFDENRKKVSTSVLIYSNILPCKFVKKKKNLWKT